MEPSIKYVRKIFRKTNISNPDTHTYVGVRIRGLKMVVFRKILRPYLMDGPYSNGDIEECQVPTLTLMIILELVWSKTWSYFQGRD